MIEVGHEPGPLVHAVDDVGEVGRRQRHHRSTVPADEMMMTDVVDEVIHHRSVPEVPVTENARLFERVEGPVHGGTIDPGAVPGSNPLVDVRRAEVIVVRSCDHLADDAAGLRDPESLPPESRNEIFGSHVHAPSVSVAASGRSDLPGRCPA